MAMKSLALVSLLVVGAAAAGSKDTTTTNLPSPVIPSGISSGCNTFLKALDSDSQLTICLKTLNGATALSSLCTSSVASACPSSIFRTQLTSMYTACNDEIGGASPNPTVALLYDTLFAAEPFRTAVCEQDNTGAFCVDTLTAKATAPSTLGGIVSSATTYLSSSLSVLGVATYKRAAAPTTQVVFPNVTTFSNSGLPFVFLTASTPTAVLCSDCAQKIIKAYVDWETSTPYATGIGASPLLSKQGAIYNAMTASCPSGFGDGVVANAGAAPSASVAQGSLASAASRGSTPFTFGSLVVAGLGFAIML